MGHDPRHFKLSPDGRTAKAAASSGEPAASGGRVVKRGPELNKTEQAYADHLDRLQGSGHIARFYVKPFNLRLGPDRFYCPDFAAVRYERDELDKLTIPKVVVVETKGFLRDDARDKFKEAIGLWPDFDFLMVRRTKAGGWETYMRSEGAVDL